MLSRTHEGFVRGLFNLEVPEIAEGIVQIKGIAREAGDRTKIAVASTDEKVDCVGACVGMRGTRVKNVVRELHGEKIDIIRWHETIREFIAAALSPAKIQEIQSDESAKQALVIVEDDQLSLAIGKKGQNVRLASKLTGWQLEIKSRSQLSAAAMSLRSLPGIGPAMEERLTKAGMTNIRQLANSTIEQLTAIEGIGEKTAQKLLESAKTTWMAQAAAAAASTSSFEAVGPEGSSGPHQAPAVSDEGPSEAAAASSEPGSDQGEGKPGEVARSGEAPEKEQG